MSRNTLAVTVALAVALSVPAVAQTSTVLAYAPIVIDGVQSASGSPARGFAQVTLDTTSNLLTWSMSYTGLLAPITAAHFHLGAPGVNGGIQISIGTANPATGTATLTPTQSADLMAGNWYINVHTMAFPAGEIRGQVVPGTLTINEVDADTAGTDTLEFIELYDGGVGNTSLDGLVLVFYNGSATSNASYLAIDLNGFTTDASGFFLVGNTLVTPTPAIIFTDNTLQNGADGVALHVGNAVTFGPGVAAADNAVIDAVVYDTADPDATALITALTPGQPQIDEASGAGSATDSIGRCADGFGGLRNTSQWVTMTPTPGASNGNNCNPFTFTISQDTFNCGPIVLSVTGATPGSELYNLISLQCSFGSGPLFGIGIDAFSQIFFPLGTIPFHVAADATGSFNLSVPTGCSTMLTVEGVSIEALGGFIFQVSPTTGCVQIAL